MCVCVCVFVCVLCTSEDWSCKITTECCAVGDLVGTTLGERERDERCDGRRVYALGNAAHDVCVCVQLAMKLISALCLSRYGYIPMSKA